jgi:ribonuclease P protein component
MCPTFPKSERLQKQKQIDELFAKGRSFPLYPFRVLWQFTEPVAGEPIRVLITVPKSLHKKAVTRNTLKRRIRESYRLTKQPLSEILTLSGRTLHIGIVYTGKELLSGREMQGKIILLLRRLQEEHEKIAG